MAATDSERTRFRRKLDGSETSMPDPYIDDVVDEAAAAYSGYSRAVILAYAYVLGFRDLKARAVKQTDYKQNDSEEKRSQMLAGLDKLEKTYQGDLDTLLEASSAPVFFGQGKVVPSRIKEYPDA